MVFNTLGGGDCDDILLGYIHNCSFLVSFFKTGYIVLDNIIAFFNRVLVISLSPHFPHDPIIPDSPLTASQGRGGESLLLFLCPIVL